MDRKRISRNGAVVRKDKCRSQRRVKDDALDAQWNALGDFNPYEGETLLQKTLGRSCILVYPYGFSGRRYLTFDASVSGIAETVAKLREYRIQISPDLVVQNGIALEPNTYIGTSCVLSAIALCESSQIESGCKNTTSDGVVYVAEASTIGQRTTLLPYGIINIGAGVRIGKYVTLIGSIEVADNCKIGNSAALQNCKIGQDTEIGSNTGISYDVEVGDGVTIGDSVDIYAGVDIGNNAFIGDDSTIETDVPEDAYIRRGTILSKDGSSEVKDSDEMIEMRKARNLRRAIKAHKVLDSAMKKYRARNGRDFRVQDSKSSRHKPTVRKKLFDQHSASGVHFIKKI